MIETVGLIDAVRRRPGMYVGNVDGDGVHHLVWELVGNVIDQHLATTATELRVDLGDDGSVEVADDGPGIPNAERYLTTMSVKGTADGHWPHVHVAPSLVGVGLFAVNALSRRLEIATRAGATSWTQAYERGRPRGAITRGVPNEGTWIRCIPDADIFPRRIDPSSIGTRLQELAWLYPYLRIVFQGRRLDGRGGLVRWAKHDAGGDAVTFAAKRMADGVLAELALAWSTRDEPFRGRWYVNTHVAPSGMHVDGVWSGLHAVARAGGYAFAVDGVRGALSPGLVAIGHVGLHGAQWANPAKEHLLSPEASKAMRALIRETLPAALTRDANLRALFESRLEINRPRP